MNLQSENMCKDKQIQRLKDFEILEKIIKNEIKIDDLDDDTKTRIIKLCNDRSKEIQQKTERIRIENEKLKEEIRKHMTNK